MLRVIIWAFLSIILITAMAATHPYMLGKPLPIVLAWAGVLGAGSLIILARVNNLMYNLNIK